MMTFAYREENIFFVVSGIVEYFCAADYKNTMHFVLGALAFNVITYCSSDYFIFPPAFVD